MTAPAIPDVEVDAELAEAIDRVPLCDCWNERGDQCTARATWIARPRPVCCLDTAALMCDEHKAIFTSPEAGLSVRCINCHKPIGVVWERL